MQYDRILTISSAGSRRAARWPAQTLRWSELLGRLSAPVRGQETLTEYLRLPKAQQDDLKDVGGYVAGRLREDRRRADAVESRAIVTLDMDSIPAMSAAVVVKAVSALGCAYAIYSTRKHEPARPRLRVLLPLCRDVTADEYEPIARKLAEYIGIGYCDPTTFQPVRMMYWPSCCAGAEYLYYYEDKPFADADGLLRLYADWRDVTSWPTPPGAPKLEQRMLGKQEDPTTKTGVVGAFCRAYSIEAAMETFLPGVYAEAGESRYTYVEGSTTGGAVTYDGKWLYSHHATDPASEKLCNAFDLVRLHKFGSMDDEAAPGTPVSRLPSYDAMLRLAAADPTTAQIVLAERAQQVKADFAEPITQTDENWMQKLELHPKTLQPLPTTNNVRVILENDPSLSGLMAYDRFASRVVLQREPPWPSAALDKQGRRPWTDGDSAGLNWYLETKYQIKGRQTIDNAFSVVSSQNAYDDVEAYLKGLKWDGVTRLDRLWVRYLGAEDNAYTRAVTRKSLVACVARALKPGTKFDYVLTLVGGQGFGKSSAIEILGKSWFNASLMSFDRNKEASELIQGSWIVELGELASLTHSELNAAKQFITRTTDRFRAAYGRFAEDCPRRCVFFGTTNKDDFLRDETGERRFWPVPVSRKMPPEDFAELTELVDQLWAEATAYYMLGERLYLPPELEAQAKVMQEQYREDDGLEGQIRAFLERPITADWYKRQIRDRRAWLQNDFGQQESASECVERVKVCAREIWAEMLGKDLAYCDGRQMRDINKALSRLGWVSARLKFGGEYGQQRGYAKAGTNLLE